MIIVEVTNETGERALWEKLKDRAIKSGWNDDPHWGQVGILWFNSAVELRDALIEATK